MQYHIFSPYRVCPLGAHVDHQRGIVTGFAIDKGVDLEFSFREFVDFAYAKKTSFIMFHQQPSVEKLQRTGVIVVDENMKVLNMEEKPQVPKSTWAVPPFYVYLKKDLGLVRHAVENGCGKDAPGNLAHYMVEHTTMHAWPMSAGRFDIGSLDTYYEAVEKYGK